MAISAEVSAKIALISHIIKEESKAQDIGYVLPSHGIAEMSVAQSCMNISMTEYGLNGSEITSPHEQFIFLC
jgi:hypothetical protein